MCGSFTGGYATDRGSANIFSRHDIILYEYKAVCIFYMWYHISSYRITKNKNDEFCLL